MGSLARGTLLGATVGTLVAPALAQAHVALLEPPARYAREHVKSGPCGHPDNPSGEVTRSYVIGETIEIRFDEYIGHPGHFRIALSTEGDGALVDPTDYDDFYSAPNVLLDDIDDPDGVSDHRIEVTLPDTPCDPCTLQLIQVMTDKPPWGPEGGNELYYQCADIRIVADESQLPDDDDTNPPPESGSDDDEGGGCAVGGSRRGTGAGWWLLLLPCLARPSSRGARPR